MKLLVVLTTWRTQTKTLLPKKCLPPKEKFFLYLPPKKQFFKRKKKFFFASAKKPIFCLKKNLFSHSKKKFIMLYRKYFWRLLKKLKRFILDVFWRRLSYFYVSKTIAYRNTWLGNTIIIFIIQEIWKNAHVNLTVHITVINDYKDEFKIRSNIWDGEVVTGFRGKLRILPNS